MLDHINEFVYSKDQFIILQSPREIVVTDLLMAIPLVCISNDHGDCTYAWECLTAMSNKYSNVPVLYVNHPGMFRCTVKSNDKTINCQCISVSLQPGLFDTIEVSDIQVCFSYAIF